MRNEGLERFELSQTNRPLSVVMHWQNEGNLLLDPPYQRGDVWGPIRRRNLVRSLLMGVPIPSIIVNDRASAEWPDDFQYAVIDGRQRITTILKFMSDELRIPGEWVGLSGEVVISDMPIGQQRKMRNRPIAFSEGTLRSIEAEQEVFELVNFGGVPQGESDVEEIV